MAKDVVPLFSTLIKLGPSVAEGRAQSLFLVVLTAAVVTFVW
jgi:hypothetical protein